MSETGGEIYTPEAGEGGGMEELSEEAKARFAAAGAAMKKIRKEEKKSRKKDGQVAQAIIQFLGDDKYAHLFVLIARLVARDCPSIFILAILSLVHKPSLEEVQNYLKDTVDKTSDEVIDESTALVQGDALSAEMNRDLIDWITRLQLVLSVTPEQILIKLMIDDKNIDGTVLQLTTFVVQEFFATHSKEAPFEKIQPLTANILQTVFEPFIGSVQKSLLKDAETEEDDDDE